MTVKRGRGRYPIQYRNPITGVLSSNSRYTDEQGKSRTSTSVAFLVDGKWVSKRNAPHNRETFRKYQNSKRGYMVTLHKSAKNHLRKKLERGREILGDNELIEAPRKGVSRQNPWLAQKFIQHFDEQVTRYGYKCPLTHIPFTMGSNNQKFEINNQVKTFSNVSPDRIFNHIGYDKQNTIFTSQLWNLTKMERPLSELDLIFKTEIMERYRAIIAERFPDQKYNFNELKNGAEPV
tara:strand:- start:752 stop:1456 length:705 start_codon:yes stop_codon:yes gene_type:complete